MRESRELLERAARSAPAPRLELDDLAVRRRRRRTRDRIVAVATALVLTLGAAGFAYVSLRSANTSELGSTGPTGQTEVPSDGLPRAERPPFVARPGQYHYRAVLFVAGGEDQSMQLDATYWWSPGDDSGRIVADAADGYGIEAGRFSAGDFPNVNGIDVSAFPLGTAELEQFLLARSAPGGASPVPMVSPPPDGEPTDGQLWRAITDLLRDPHVTPIVRAALLDVAASLEGSEVLTDRSDPAGRPAHVIEFENWGGVEIDRLYVDPATHDLLAWTTIPKDDHRAFRIFLVQQTGVVDTIEMAPDRTQGTWPSTLLSVEDLTREFAENT
jgi:hypothetical protein